MIPFIILMLMGWMGFHAFSGFTFTVICICYWLCIPPANNNPTPPDIDF